MVITRSQQMGITLPITSEFQQMAQRFAQMCPFAEKAERIRRNTLAVCAVNAYLQLMEIPTAIAQADSWNPMMQLLSDVADLPLPGVGVLSCRVADAETAVCTIPPEAWTERIGYVAVTIDEAAHEATLIGFSPSAYETERLALSQFSPIENLVDRVHELRSSQATSGLMLTRLSEWIEDTVLSIGASIGSSASAGWLAVDVLVNPAEPSFAFRGANLAEPATTADASRARLVDLGLQLGVAVRVALVIHITEQLLDESAGDAAVGTPKRSNIVLQVRPLGDSPYIEENLTMTVLDEQSVPFMSVTSREIDNYIQLQLSGQTGEQFGVKIAIGEAVFEEQFVI